MRLLLATILIFATVVFYCSALPAGKGKVHSSGLLESANAKEYGNPLQRRKPPIKIPGPKLSADEETSAPEKEQKMKKLSGVEKSKDRKRKNAVNESKRNGDPKEETEEE